MPVFIDQPLRRPRDTQKGLLYLVENVYEELYDNRSLTLRQAQEMVNKVVSDSFWNSVIGSRRGITVRRKNTDYSQAEMNGRVIGLSRWGHNDQTVLHELAHILIAQVLYRRVQFHGPEFAWVLRELWREQLPEKAPLWEELANQEGIRFRRGEIRLR